MYVSSNFQTFSSFMSFMTGAQGYNGNDMIYLYSDTISNVGNQVFTLQMQNGGSSSYVRSTVNAYSLNAWSHVAGIC